MIVVFILDSSHVASYKKIPDFMQIRMFSLGKIPKIISLTGGIFIICTNSSLQQDLAKQLMIRICVLGNCTHHRLHRRRNKTQIYTKFPLNEIKQVELIHFCCPFFKRRITFGGYLEKVNSEESVFEE